MSHIDELVGGFLVELKRGTLTLAVLSQLQEPRYGYALLQELEEKNVGIEAGTLYPLLRRLEKQGLLKSEWDTAETRPRKYYVLSETGADLYDRLRLEWFQLSTNMNRLMMKGEHDGDHR